VLIIAGLHVPVIPLVDVDTKAGAALFWHNGPICVKTGVTSGVIVMSIETTEAHCPPLGVKVWVVVPAFVVLIIAGLHVPVIPLVDVDTKAGAELF